jgi:hypothetical protein
MVLIQFYFLVRLELIDQQGYNGDILFSSTWGSWAYICIRQT